MTTTADVAAGAASDTTISSSSQPNFQNSAFVFIKPAANTEKVRTFVKETLQKEGMTILSEKSIDSKTIHTQKLIDYHYYSIASKATLIDGKKLPVPTKKFQHSFHESWDHVIKTNRAMNAIQACKYWKITSNELNEIWRREENNGNGNIVKLGGGFYCGKLSHHNNETIYVFNAFFLNMREKFIKDGSSIYCYEIQWEPTTTTWNKFRNQILGPTNPNDAPRGSLRRTILDQWKEFGLKEAPSKGDNGVHASASPWEGLVERNNWLKRDMKKDETFGKHLLKIIPMKVLKEWSKDPQVILDEDGSTTGSIFDALEDMDAAECYNRMVELYEFNYKKKNAKQKTDEL